MRFLLLLLSLVLQLNVSGYANFIPQENHAQKTLTSENSEINGRSNCAFRFQGQYEDYETGLYYNRFRYSLDEGMYLSQDSIRLAGNNPTLYGSVKDVNSWVDVFGFRYWGYIKYRSGNNTLNNYTPKLPKDMGGLSTFTSLEILQKRLPNAEKVQMLYLSKLGGDLIAVDGIKIVEWGSLKGKDGVHNPLA